MPGGYGFVRDTGRWGVNSLPFQKYGDLSWLFNGDDRNLGLALAAAQKANRGSGIWVAARNDETPQQYARRLASLANTYHPQILVPDVEFVGKGYQGSKGWDWNEAMISLFRALAPNQKLGLTVMPNQRDFNYGAYQRRGVNTFLPQAYGETYATKFQPQQVVETLVAAGVPRNLIQPVLAPGQSYSGPSSYYALDDFGGPVSSAGPARAVLGARRNFNTDYSRVADLIGRRG